MIGRSRSKVLVEFSISGGSHTMHDKKQKSPHSAATVIRNFRCALLNPIRSRLERPTKKPDQADMNVVFD